MIAGAVRHRFSLPSSIVALDVELGVHTQSALHLVCAKSALGIPRVRAVADLIVAELERQKAPAP